LKNVTFIVTAKRDQVPDPHEFTHWLPEENAWIRIRIETSALPKY
jgi:ribosomal protein L28